MSIFSKEIAENATLEQLVHVYQEAEAVIRRNFQETHEALDKIGRYFESDGDKPYIYPSRNSRSNFGDIYVSDLDNILAELRRTIWRRLIERAQIHKIMSVKAWEDLQRKLDQDEPQEVTTTNLESFAENLQDQAGDMLRDAVKEVFEFLRPHHSQHKTNTEFEIGEKVILTWAVEIFYSKTFQAMHSRNQQFQALDNVFNLLDGRVADTQGAYYSPLNAAIRECTLENPTRETEFFKIKCHKNRNLHITFKRIDLVKKLNAVAGGMRIKPPEV